LDVALKPDFLRGCKKKGTQKKNDAANQDVFHTGGQTPSPGSFGAAKGIISGRGL
jgi:hypothetical protein